MRPPLTLQQREDAALQPPQGAHPEGCAVADLVGAPSEKGGGALFRAVPWVPPYFAAVHSDESQMQQEQR